MTQTATRLVCHAPHRTERGQNCGGSCGSSPTLVQFWAVLEREPDPHEGFHIAPCRNCGRWNVYRKVEAA